MCAFITRVLIRGRKDKLIFTLGHSTIRCAIHGIVVEDGNLNQ